MDVYRPQDKALVQSKLNELGSKLKTVAAGDFSNQQLVNSVGGMASSIIKDPLVQNAVSSTASYKKAMEERKAYQKEGKASPSNDFDLTKRHDNWLNNHNKTPILIIDNEIDNNWDDILNKITEYIKGL
jgi:hypothetical protein